MTLPQIVSLVSTSLLTILAVIIGIQLITILKEVKYTLTKINNTLDTVESTVQKLSQPAAGFIALLEGIKQSGKIVESVSQFLGKRKPEPPINVEAYESEGL